MWESESEPASGREFGSGILTSSNLDGVKTDGFQRRGHSWYVKMKFAEISVLFDIIIIILIN